ncbi:MAG: transcription antitermination factor NusB [Prevotella sp.]|jgi:N utilization substance protein B|nr:MULTISPECIES: transcription antitermination factor NusB [unclassified Prevotella]MCH3970519.1 transcription antitermination factor NusB [Prevotella sp.]MCH3986153.1 transcription antitermination factor NusB [Prevotella sp.]MCH4018113.1 transcription antitermination factor NusB [Prevotella sp.]MCH4186951.1 transcription antitermination factor NusB [Prevotella sp.]MCH4215335.1 transcription antitermination factor NusB [Prevotella sp.]
MINRELIRIKIVQLTYAYYQNGDRNIDNAEKELLFSLSKAYDLYNDLLALIVAVTKEARSQEEILAARAAREGKEPPSQKFAYNKFAVQLEENKMLSEFVANQKTTWEDDLEFVRKLLSQMQQSDLYKDYLAGPDESYEAEREFWRKLYKQNIQENSDLDALLEDKSLYWNDDKEIVDTFVLKTIKRFDPEKGSKQELLPEYKDEEDRDFARKLFRATILNADNYQHYMSEASRNWDFSRLAYMDVVIMQIAIAEMLTFQNIPISVTINEYVNLAKLYSTYQSGRYVNGMLDAIARHLNETGKMAKPMSEPRPRVYPEEKKRTPRGTSGRRLRIQDEENQLLNFKHQETEPSAPREEGVEKPDAPVDKEEDESAQTPSADHAVEKTDNQVEPEGEK